MQQKKKKGHVSVGYKPAGTAVNILKSASLFFTDNNFMMRNKASLIILILHELSA